MSFSSGINKVFLIGRILKDGRCHNYHNEKPSEVCLQLVTEEKITKNGEEILHQEQHTIRMSEKIADSSILLKDRMMYLEGSVKTKSFTDGGGVKHYRSEIWVHRYELLS